MRVDVNISRKTLRWSLGALALSAWLVFGWNWWTGRKTLPRATMLHCDLEKRGYLVGFSPLTILVNRTPGEIILWDTATGTKRGILKERLAAGPAFSPDGKRIATVGTDQIIRIWDAQTGKTVASLPAPTAVKLDELACSCEAQVRAGAGVGRLSLWNVPSGERRDLDVSALRLWLSPDGGALALTNQMAQIELWDVRTGKRRSTLPVQSAWQVAFSSDGRTLATSEGDGSVKLRNVETGQVRARYQPAPGIGHLSFSPDSTILAVTYRLSPAAPKLSRWLPLFGVEPSRTATVLINTPDGQKLATLPGRSHIGFWPDGKTLVTWDTKGDCLELWDVPPPAGRGSVAIYVLLGVAISVSAGWWIGISTSWARRRSPKAPLAIFMAVFGRSCSEKP